MILFSLKNCRHFCFQKKTNKQTLASKFEKLNYQLSLWLKSTNVLTVDWEQKLFILLDVDASKLHERHVCTCHMYALDGT